MKKLIDAVFSQEFEPMEHIVEGKIHKFKFKTKFINVNQVASATEVGGQRLKVFIGPNGHRFKPKVETTDIIDVLAETSTDPYAPYTLTITISEESQFFKELLERWRKTGRE